MNDPRVTVIIPVYNGERYIAEAVRSVLAQTVPVRLVVVNDGSTDGTIEAIEALDCNDDYYQSLIMFERNYGAAHALNAGIRHADTEFVAWLSHDDVFTPDKIERQLAAIGDADACFTNFDIINADGHVVELVKVKPPPAAGMFRQIITRNIINGSSMLLRRDVFERVGFFRENLRVDVDGEMWLRMIGAGMSFVHVPEPLLLYRRHAGQLSADRELMHRTKDQVRAEAIERTPPEMAFPVEANRVALTLRSQLPLSTAYRNLAQSMSAQSLTLAAAAARHKSLDVLETPDLHTDL